MRRHRDRRRCRDHADDCPLRRRDRRRRGRRHHGLTQPPTDNGIKLWSPSGQAFDAEKKAETTETVEARDFDLAAHDGVGDRTTAGDARNHHAAVLQNALTDPAVESLSVAVDIGNGTGRITADVLNDADCDVETLNGQRDGRFPGRPSEPTAEHCTTACALVEATDADLGILHDGDADRMLVIDNCGRFVGGDALLALFGRRATGAGDRVAVPVDTSLAVADILTGEGAEASTHPSAMSSSRSAPPNLGSSSAGNPAARGFGPGARIARTARSPRACSSTSSQARARCWH